MEQEIVNVKISDIKISDRFRQEFLGIEELAKNIEVNGLIHPITLDENNNLIAGERRLRAYILLGKETIPAIIFKNLNYLQKKEIELSENIKRKNFTWQEEIQAKYKLHELYISMHGKAIKGHGSGWSLDDTAKTLNLSVGSIHQDITLHKALQVFPELNVCDNKAQAFSKYKQLQLTSLKKELSELQLKKGIESPSFILGDCLDIMSTMEDDSIDLIITDPPYGINLDKTDSFTDIYNDDPEIINSIIEKAVKEFYRLLKPNRHLWLFFPISKYQWTVDVLRKVGFEVCLYPLIWDKGTNTFNPIYYSLTSSYESILFARKGKERKLNNYCLTVIKVDPLSVQSRIHPLERPPQLLNKLIELSSEVGEVVFDPFAGSGSTIVCAYNLKRAGKGIEKEPKYHSLALERLKVFLYPEQLKNLGYNESQINLMSGNTKQEILEKNLTADKISILPDGSYKEVVE